MTLIRTRSGKRARLSSVYQYCWGFHERRDVINVSKWQTILKMQKISTLWNLSRSFQHRMHPIIAMDLTLDNNPKLVLVNTSWIHAFVFWEKKPVRSTVSKLETKFIKTTSVRRGIHSVRRKLVPSEEIEIVLLNISQTNSQIFAQKLP